MIHRSIRCPRLWTSALMMILITTCLGIAQESVKNPPFFAAVSVEVRDHTETPLRVVNGTLLDVGVIVELTALHGGAWAEVRSRDGGEWRADSVITVNPQVNLALLKLDEIPTHAIRLPESTAYTDGGRLILIGGPNCETDSLSVTAYRHFKLQDGFDLIPLSRAFPGAAPALGPDGRLIGVSADLSTEDVSIGYLVPTASIKVVVRSGSRPRPFSMFADTEPPEYMTDESSRGLALRGAILTRSGSSALAREFLTLALQRDQHCTDAHYWMGEFLLASDEPKLAAESFANAAAVDSTYGRAWCRAGFAYSGAGLHQEAEKMYFRALEVDTCSAESYLGVGVVRFNQGRHDEAIDLLQESLACDSTYHGGLAFYNLVVVYNAMGRRKEAERVCDTLSGLNPKLAERARRMLHGHHH
ncbi:tetratricopeptide repeat protein [Candidatus Eisenbacteria bacterium]|uniref:Tetratricopeptide repeat protein n=1 Tax=Eiseniibacteriota bacterium TaxID=2212470 RepID=A0ABV6YIX5_UNCEI